MSKKSEVAETKTGTTDEVQHLSDLTGDPHNANRGTSRGLAALDRSLRDYGAGRSVLIDRAGRVIAGNKTVERARELGLGLRIVSTDGQELIAVQRQDLDLLADGRSRARAGDRGQPGDRTRSGVGLGRTPATAR